MISRAALAAGLLAAVLPVATAQATPGALDGSYGDGGAAAIAIPSAFADGQAAGLVATTGGRTVAAGTASRGGSRVAVILGQLRSGAPDPAIGGGRPVALPVGVADADVADIARDGSGRLLVASTAAAAEGPVIAVTRLLRDGRVDPTFGDHGTATIAGPGITEVFAAAIDVDGRGRIVVGGTLPAHARLGWLVARLTATGALDRTFDGDGLRVESLSSDEDGLEGLDATADGSVVAVGFARTTGSAAPLTVLRLRPDGSRDPAFGGGVVQVPLAGADAGGAAVVVVPGGAVLVAGTRFGTPATAVVARLTPGGALDPAFGGGDGWAEVGPQAGVAQSRGVDLVRRASGAIVLVAEARGATSAFLLARFDPTGGLVEQAVLDPGGAGASVPTDLVDADGTLAVHGSTRLVENESRWAWARLADIGAPAGRSGTVAVASGPGPDSAERVRMAAVGDGVAVVGLRFDADAVHVARLDADGRLDPVFSGDGRIAIPVARASRAALAARSDGSLVVAASSSGTSTVATLGAFRADGTPVPGFGSAGIVAFTAGPTPARVHEVVAEPGGGATVATVVDVGASRRIAIHRRTASGAPDATFGGGTGVVQLAMGLLRNVLGLHRLADGRYLVIALVTAAADTRLAFVRLEADGDPDLTFGGGTGVVQSALGDPQNADDGGSIVLADGRIVVVTTGTDGPAETGIVLRLTPDGAPDATFGAVGLARVAIPDHTVRLDAVAVAPDGALVVGGLAFPSSGDVGAIAARLRPDGSLDGTFGSGGLHRTSQVGYESAHVAADGRILVASAALQRMAVHRLLGELPGALTAPPLEVGETSALLRGVVDLRRLTGVASRFALVGVRLTAPRPVVATGPVEARVRGLRPGRTYRVRFEAVGASGVAGGTPLAFRTRKVRPRVTLRPPVVGATTTLRGVAIDPAPSSGVRRVEVRILRRVAGGCLSFRGRATWRLVSRRAAERAFVRTRLGRGGARRTWSIVARGVTPGAYALTVRAVDGAGLRSRPVARRLRRP